MKQPLQLEPVRVVYKKWCESTMKQCHTDICWDAWWAGMEYFESLNQSTIAELTEKLAKVEAQVKRMGEYRQMWDDLKMFLKVTRNSGQRERSVTALLKMEDIEQTALGGKEG